MSKLKNYCLNITDGEHGSIIDDPDGEYYFLNNNNITEDGIVINPNDRRMSKKEFERINKRTQLSTNDVVIATCGTLGKTQVITDTSINYDFSRSVGIIKTDPQKLLPLFLHYYFKNPHTQKRIERIAEGAVQKHFYIGAMEDFEVEIPDIGIQKDIISAISKIDGKISNNKSICSDLESMAKLLYDYWFVQFDFPDENGKPYKSSGGKMVWNEELKREIPDGWSAKKLSKIADIVTTSITTENSSYYLHYSIPAFDENKMPSNDKGDAIDSNKYLVPDNAVLVSKLNPHFQRVWWVGKHRKNSICSTEFMPFVAQTNIYEYLYSLLKSEQFYTFMVNSSSSSTGSRKRMQPDLCLDFMIPYPDDDRIIHSYCSITNPVLQKVSESLKENQQLASLRDFLLPMLMNGQVKVKEGETQ